MMGPDKRAIRILHDTYWSPAGWKRDREVTAEDFAYAKAQGVMFEAVTFTHDEVVMTALRAVAATHPHKVVEAFVASLSSRRLDLRSALGSYAVGRHMQPHHKAVSSLRSNCSYCGAYNRSDADFNAMNFERFKWGGVRHADPEYIAFDLARLSAALDILPRAEDLAILRSIFAVAGSMSSKARPRDLDKALATVLPSNSSERRTLIGILGYAGILVDPDRPDFRKHFVPVEQRERTPWHTDDWPYPIQWWNGSYGVNQSAVDEWFASF
jgi:hypothetical protein